jgi:hypothetical protein
MIAAQQIGVALGDASASEQAESDHQKNSFRRSRGATPALICILTKTTINQGQKWSGGSGLWSSRRRHRDDDIASEEWRPGQQQSERNTPDSRTALSN